MPPFLPSPSPGALVGGREREGGIHPSDEGHRAARCDCRPPSLNPFLISLPLSLSLAPTRPTRQIERIIHSGEIAPRARTSLLRRSLSRCSPSFDPSELSCPDRTRCRAAHSSTPVVVSQFPLSFSPPPPPPPVLPRPSFSMISSDESGIMFPVKCKDILPVDHVVINSVAVRGALGPLTVW